MCDVRRRKIYFEAYIRAHPQTFILQAVPPKKNIILEFLLCTKELCELAFALARAPACATTASHRSLEERHLLSYYTPAGPLDAAIWYSGFDKTYVFMFS